ncbi:ankyrin repeat and SOCS box protein 6-like [Diretmus argenteus]
MAFGGSSEYQPLLDAVLCVVGLKEGASREGGCSPRDDNGLCSALVELLERESQSDVFHKGIGYALDYVAEMGLVCDAEVLLDYGADLNFEDPVFGFNPLHIAVTGNRPDMVKMLVRRGADIDKRGFQLSPLDLASELTEQLPCLLALLDLGADVNASNSVGKTPLLHALEEDGPIVDNTGNIRLLLHRGADVHAATVDGDTAVSHLVSMVTYCLEANVEDAAEIGSICMSVARLLLAHGANGSCCLNGNGKPSLMQTSLEHFDLLFPLAVLLLQSGASFVCSYHGASCWSGYRFLFHRLQAALQQCSDESQASELLEQTEVLLDVARVATPTLPLPPRLELPAPGQNPHVQALLDLHGRLVEQDTSPPALRCLCRASIRHRLRPWPLEDRVKALPLPDRLKDFLLPEHTYSPKPGWDCFNNKSNNLWQNEDIVDEFKKQLSIKRLGQPEEIGGVIAFLCSKDASYITGETITVTGGISCRL